jgi:hypothetical protein
MILHFTDAYIAGPTMSVAVGAPFVTHIIWIIPFGFAVFAEYKKIACRVIACNQLASLSTDGAIAN